MSRHADPSLGEFATREFPMTNHDFERIKEITLALSGITLTDHKRNMVYGRLSRRLRRLDVACFADYCDLLEASDEQERTEFINAITTNLTSFFREGHHFDYLKSHVLPKLISANAKQRKIRLWSAGCSTGEEPYSIAMVVSSMPQIKGWDVKILATDLDTNVVQHAKEGIYLAERAEGIPEHYRRFLRVDKSRENVKVCSQVQDLIAFKSLNLLDDWPMKGLFDVIFCRNVVIYFNADTQRVLFDRYANILASDGMLFIGHSESLHNISQRFKPLGRTIYQRCE